MRIREEQESLIWDSTYSPQLFPVGSKKTVVDLEHPKKVDNKEKLDLPFVSNAVQER